MQPGVDILNLTEDFSATGSNVLGVKNIETITMSGASSKHIAFLPYDAAGQVVSITIDGNGNDRYLVVDSDSQNQKLSFANSFGGLLQASDVIDLGGGAGDTVYLSAAGEVSVANVENINILNNNTTVRLTSSAGSNNVIFVQQNNSIDLTQSAGNDIITHQFGSSISGVAVTGFNATVDRIKLNRGQYSGDADSDGAIDSGKLRAGAGITTPGDSDDFWIFDTTTKILHYDNDADGGGSSTDQIIAFDSTSTVDGSNIGSVIALISSQVPEFS